METGSRNILLVEDNPDDEALTVRALKRANVANNIVIARDGVEAVEYLFGEGRYAGRDVSDLPSFIMLDLKLPKMDGFEVLKRVRADERTSSLPIVVLTTSDEQKDIADCYCKGANSYPTQGSQEMPSLPEDIPFLSKPVNLKVLAREMREVLDEE